MTGTTTSTDRHGNRAFLRRVTVAASWGQGLDGYDLGVLSVVIGLAGTELGISAGWLGLIGASSLIGIFLGAPVVGRLTDRFGRRRLFTADVAVLGLAGLAQAFVGEGWQLFAVRLVLGLAIGAEYAIGAPLLAEFLPAAGRGRRLALLQVNWYVGFLVAVVVGYALLALGVHWRWVLATSAVPAAVTFVVRRELPESPRWLLSRGRAAEAHRVVDEHLGGDAWFAEHHLEEEVASAGTWRTLFSPRVRSRTVFVCVFWACLVAPYFAIFTFAPRVLGSLEMTDERAATLFVNGIAAVGSVAGFLLIRRLGSRQMLIGPFWVMAVSLLVLGVWNGAPVVVVVLAFSAFAFTNAVSGNMTAVYAPEVFPTDVRTSGVGVASAASRVGAAAGTWLLPLGLDTIGVGACLLIGGAVCAVGAVVSHLMAPRTDGLDLTTTSSAPLPQLAREHARSR